MREFVFELKVLENPPSRPCVIDFSARAVIRGI